MNSLGVEFRQVDKRFGSCHPSRALSFRVRPGTIHGLIGENGAGKSTAMKLLFGMLEPDSGEILVNGTPARFRSPADAVAAGIGMVHQHFMLAPPLSALDNFLLSRPGRAWSWLSRAEQLREARALGEKLRFEIPWERPVEQLSVGEQQRLEILKVLADQPRLLILDEPTAVLSPPETKDFLARLRVLRDEGRTLILISHKLHEIMQVCDDVTVLRAGQVVGTVAARDTSVESLAELMIGHRERAWHSTPAATLGECRLKLGSVSLQDPRGKRLEALDLEIRAGEIVGIAGVEGNGQDLLLDLLAAPASCRARATGTLEVLGQSAWSQDNRSLRNRGVAFFPEDRLRFGVMAARSAPENYLLGRRHALARGPWLSPVTARHATEAMMRAFQVTPVDLELPLGSFSGGNQQKFVVGRELEGNPTLVIAAYPTRGVDLGAVRAIHDHLVEARDRGAGVLLVSSELDELMRLCDRVHVIFRGRLLARFERGAYDEVSFGLAMGGREFA